MTVSALKKKLVLQAVDVLRSINKEHFEDSSKKKPLLEDEDKSTLFIHVTLKKIPQSELIKMIKVNLPHPLVRDTDEVCLITGDLDKMNRKAEIEPDVLHYKELLNKHDITQISQVLTLRQLRTEYKPFEAKLKLAAAYDMFLADSKIAECLPRVLGKHFFKKRKFPIQVNMKTSNLKQQIEKALSTKVFHITGHGNSCSSEVAYLDMDDSKILDNVMAVSKSLSEKLPGMWDNVMGIYLKTSRSKAIPVYVSYDNPNDVNLEDDKEECSVEIDELTTIPNVKVKVYSDGNVETVHFKEVLETSFVETNEKEIKKSNLYSNFQESDLKNEKMKKTKKVKNYEIESTGDEVIKKSKRVKEESVSNECESHENPIERKRRKGKYQNATGKKNLTASVENDEIINIVGDRNKKSKQVKRKCKNQEDPIQGKGKIKNALEEKPLTTSTENNEIIDITNEEKRKKGKNKNASENKPLTISIENNEIIDIANEGKKRKGKNKSAIENKPLTISVENNEIIDISNKGKRKKGKNENASENKPLTTSIENEFLERNKRSKLSKRKRAESESVILDPIEPVKESETPVQERKKRKIKDESSESGKRSNQSKKKKFENESVIVDLSEPANKGEIPIEDKMEREIEGINMKRYQSRKELRKSKKKKENQHKTK